MAARRGEPAGGNAHDERVVDHEMMPVVIHSTPRYGRFLAIGVVGGLVAAAVMTIVSGATEGRYGPMSAPSGPFLVLALNSSVCVAIGLVLMGSLALLLGRKPLRGARAATAEHATTLVHDMDAPVTDRVPLWSRDPDDPR